ncbi:uncharacterized protein LOC100114509 [Nasonia vitripennis]|uniref:THAP-type domain-containing protein n=1 Tax=Nasonia vitripennis TaxID=7425 RepID=A0A7M7PX61_NASVI|nr:uncharacterized protein LOC100114509 [Nasonia vitripennis]XP_031778021.1 uncharacterized protein LOC100114509 [Nasonia vitripennis]
MKCTVINCNNKIKFRFPSNYLIKNRWLEAIGRPTFVPRLSHGLCIEHFNPEDIITESYRDGYKLQNIRLKRGAVPIKCHRQSKNDEKITEIETVYLKEEYSVNEFGLDSNTAIKLNQSHNVVDEDPSSNGCTQVYSTSISNGQSQSVSKYFNKNFVGADENENGSDDYKNDIEMSLPNNCNSNIQCDMDVSEQEICNDVSKPCKCNQTNHQNNFKIEKLSISSQTHATPRYTITDFKKKPKSLFHFIGLENYEKFLAVLHSLGPDVYHLKYVRTIFGNLGVPDQLFLVLWKLRRYPNDIELAEHFNLSEVDVRNIFITWILYMSKVWSHIDLWPKRELIDFYMSKKFEKYYSSEYVTVDEMEIKTATLSNFRERLSPFGTCKKTDTIKPGIAGSPDTLISDSLACEGLVSDCSIIEQSDSCKKCQSKDTAICDKGSLAQNFTPCNQAVSTKTPLVTDSIPNKTVKKLIKLIETFTILSEKLSHHYIPLKSEILGVCIILTNYNDKLTRV